jgi:hypothetical protein
MKIYYLCIVESKMDLSALGSQNYRSGQAKNSRWAGRKNEVETNQH